MQTTSLSAMVCFRTRISVAVVISVYANAVIFSSSSASASTTTSSTTRHHAHQHTIAGSGTNHHHNNNIDNNNIQALQRIQGLWRRTRNDVETIRRQSKIKISEMKERLGEIDSQVHGGLDNLPPSLFPPSLISALGSSISKANQHIVHTSSQRLLRNHKNGGRLSVDSEGHDDDDGMSKVQNVGARTKAVATMPPKRRQNNSGFYYGIRDDIFFPQKDSDVVNEEEPEPADEESSLQNGGRYGRMGGINPIRPPSGSIGGGGTNTNPILNPTTGSSSSMPGMPGVSSSTSKALTDIMGETLIELREMREDIYALREEMQYMKEEFKKQKELTSSYRDGTSDPDDQIIMDHNQQEQDEQEVQIDSYEYTSPDSTPQQQQQRRQKQQSLVERVRRQNEFESIGRAVEKWAHKLLFEEDGEKDGWKEVKCNKMVRKKFNPKGSTSCYIKWMKDSRGPHARPSNDDGSSGGNHDEFPCVKVFASIDAPIEDVCEYLSQESHMEEYNDLVIAHRDLEEVTPHSKICWSQCPQILFIKPRDFVTYCHHRWRRDGTQIVVSQACDHESAPGNNEESDERACRAYSLRGANCKC